VDGTGLAPVTSGELQARLLDKTNNLNDSIFLWSVIPVLVYALLPLETSKSLVGGAVAFTVLYILADLQVGIVPQSSSSSGNGK